MHAYNDIDGNPPPRELLRFGIVFLLGFGFWAIWEYFGAHRTASAILLAGIAVAVFALSFVRPVGRRLYWLWMAFGITIGRVTTPLILALIWIVVFVPLALALRAFRHDALRLRHDARAKSYWEDYPNEDRPERFFRQY